MKFFLWKTFFFCIIFIHKYAFCVELSKAPSLGTTHLNNKVIPIEIQKDQKLKIYKVGDKPSSEVFNKEKNKKDEIREKTKKENYIISTKNKESLNNLGDKIKDYKVNIDLGEQTQIDDKKLNDVLNSCESNKAPDIFSNKYKEASLNNNNIKTNNIVDNSKQTIKKYNYGVNSYPKKSGFEGFLSLFNKNVDDEEYEIINQRQNKSFKINSIFDKLNKKKQNTNPISNSKLYNREKTSQIDNLSNKYLNNKLNTNFKNKFQHLSASNNINKITIPSISNKLKISKPNSSFVGNQSHLSTKNSSTSSNNTQNIDISSESKKSFNDYVSLEKLKFEFANLKQNIRELKKTEEDKAEKIIKLLDDLTKKQNENTELREKLLSYERQLNKNILLNINQENNKKTDLQYINKAFIELLKNEKVKILIDILNRNINNISKLNFDCLNTCAVTKFNSGGDIDFKRVFFNLASPIKPIKSHYNDNLQINENLIFIEKRKSLKINNTRIYNESLNNVTNATSAIINNVTNKVISKHEDNEIGQDNLEINKLHFTNLESFKNLNIINQLNKQNKILENKILIIELDKKKRTKENYNLIKNCKLNKYFDFSISDPNECKNKLYETVEKYEKLDQTTNSQNKTLLHLKSLLAKINEKFEITHNTLQKTVKDNQELIKLYKKCNDEKESYRHIVDSNLVMQHPGLNKISNDNVANNFLNNKNIGYSFKSLRDDMFFNHKKPNKNSIKKIFGNGKYASDSIISNYENDLKGYIKDPKFNFLEIDSEMVPINGGLKNLNSFLKEDENHMNDDELGDKFDINKHVTEYKKMLEDKKRLSNLLLNSQKEKMSEEDIENASDKGNDI